MDKKEMEKIISKALKELTIEIDKLCMKRTVSVPLPRPKEFTFFESDRVKVVWPGFRSKDSFERIVDKYVEVLELYKNDDLVRRVILTKYYVQLAERLVSYCGGQPRKVLRVLRRIQAAAEWCRRRSSGLDRAAEEILRQQKKAVEALEDEAAMNALKG